MYLFVELWKAKPEWMALSQKDRQEYMAQVGAAIEELSKAGVEIAGWGLNDRDTSHRGDYTYFAAWKMPDKSVVKQFEETVEQAGWYNYFEQINGRGELISPETAIGHMIEL
jgi:hypothetical protein